MPSNNTRLVIVSLSDCNQISQLLSLRENQRFSWQSKKYVCCCGLLRHCVPRNDSNIFMYSRIRHPELVSTTVPNNFTKKHLQYSTIKNLEFNKLCPDNNLHI